MGLKKKSSGRQQGSGCMKYTLTQLVNSGFQLYCGLEKASHVSNGCKQNGSIFFSEPCLKLKKNR